MKIKNKVILILSVVFLSIVLCVYLSYIRRIMKPMDLSYISKKIDRVISEEFIRRGVSDKELIEWHHEEKTIGNIIWLFVKKEVLVPEEWSLEEWMDRIKPLLDGIDVEIYSEKYDEKEGSLKIDIGKYYIIM